MSITIIILLAVAIAYFGAHHTRASWIIMTAAVVVMCVVILGVLSTFLSEFIGIGIPSPKEVFHYFFSKQMLKDILAYIENSIEKTPPAIYILLAFEVSYLIAYILLPLLGNAIYLKSPGNKDYNWLLKKKYKRIEFKYFISKRIFEILAG